MLVDMGDLFSHIREQVYGSLIGLYK